MTFDEGNNLSIDQKIAKQLANNVRKRSTNETEIKKFNLGFDHNSIFSMNSAQWTDSYKAYCRSEAISPDVIKSKYNDSDNSEISNLVAESFSLCSGKKKRWQKKTESKKHSVQRKKSSSTFSPDASNMQTILDRLRQIEEEMD